MTELEPKALEAAIRCDRWADDMHEIVDAVCTASDDHDLSTEQCIALGVILERKRLDTATITPAAAEPDAYISSDGFQVLIPDDKAGKFKAAWDRLPNNQSGLNKALPIYLASPPDVSISPKGEGGPMQRLIKAGDMLSYAAQTTGGTAGRDDGLAVAIEVWSNARDAVLASPAVGQRETWQDISTAPKDGGHMLLFSGMYWPTGEIGLIPNVVVGSYRKSQIIAGHDRPASWRPVSSNALDNERLAPTHWQPLPSPPSPGGK